MNEQIEKYFIGKLTSAQKNELLEWTIDDSDAKNEFSGILNSLAFAASTGSGDDVQKARPYQRNFRKLKNRKMARDFFIGLSKYAAILVVGMCIAWWILQKLQVEEKPAVSYQKLTVPAGQRAMLTLADGTTVWINSKSTLEYPGVFTDGKREVKLTGEAYFDVAPNPAQAFIVKSGKFSTQATGTQFNVFAYNGFFIVSLVEGQVKVYETNTARNAIVLSPNEQAAWTNERLVKKSLPDTNDFLWKEGIYSFDDMTFPAIVEKLELYYDVQIHINNKELMMHKYTGKFRQRDGIESVLKVIQMDYPFVYRKSEDGRNIYIQ